MEETFAALERLLAPPSALHAHEKPSVSSVTVAGYCLRLLGWLATGFMLGLGMTIGQVLAG